MENVFNKNMKRTSLSDYEKLFKEATNKDYKEYLYNAFINEDKTSDEIANYLNMKLSILKNHLKHYGIKKDYVPDTDSVMNKTPSMIEKETGRKFVDIYNELANQGLSLTEITMKLHIKNISTVSTYLHRIKQQEKGFDESKLIIKGLKGKGIDYIEKMFREQLGIEYKDFLKQKYIDEGFPISHIVELTGISNKNIERRLKEYGFRKTRSQIRQEQMKRGTINYDKILSKGRKSRNNSKSSHKQDLLINLLKYKLESMFNELENIEIIIGYNEYCILGSMEVDIPIIIFKDDKVYKIAIEYDGDVWHKDREDINIDKEIKLIENKWFFIQIEETNSESSSLGKVEEKVNLIIDQIKKYINN